VLLVASPVELAVGCLLRKEKQILIYKAQFKIQHSVFLVQYSIRPMTIKERSCLQQARIFDLRITEMPFIKAMYLNTHSYHSLRYGTISIEDLVEDAIKCNVKALALTDINNVTGVFDFVKLCRKKKIEPIAGIDFRDGNKHLFTGIARNNEGFRELNEMLSNFNIHNEPYNPVNFNHSFVIHPFGSKTIKELKDNEFIGVRPADLNHIITSDYRKNLDKLVVSHPVTFKNPDEYELHKNLRAIENNILLSRLTPAMKAAPDEIMQPMDILYKIYSWYPEIIKNTERLVSDCSFHFEFGTNKNKKTFTGSTYEDKILLESLTMEGLKYRYGENDVAKKRLINELHVIDKLGFSSYFLIAWDIIRFSMSKGFYHVGRGSGANSIAAYCLKITDVDPIDLNLYFERFINPKRSSPPDFDIDYSWKDRDHVQTYIFNKYDSRHTALLGTNPVFKDKGIVRELGKVYGLPKEEMDAFIDNPRDDMNNNEIIQKILSFSEKMYGMPNIRSIHAGGILISEKPITYYTALDMPPKGYPTTQWDMYVAEDIGFEKFDILSQRGIGHISECVEIVSENKGVSVDVHQVEQFKKDPDIKKLIENGETIGCFYVESPAMRGLLKKLRCNNYLTLVAASSIIRPGVSSSGMMREYILRFHNPKGFKYLHPIMEEQLGETFGVMVYQEDVLKICHHFAGLDLADADVLRRIMSGKPRFKAEFSEITDKFFNNCKERGYPDELTNEVWRQISSFAGYSFSKAHSASYAVESYQSLYLKAHYPLEFMTAVINNFGGFYTARTYFNEAKRWGATVHLPCINRSNFKTCIKEKTIFIGFIHVANLEGNMVNGFLTERSTNGEFSDLSDFVRRTACGIEQLIILIRSGAFAFTGKTKAALLWEAHFLHKKETKITGSTLFNVNAKSYKMPELLQHKIEDAYDEIELIGFPVSLSFFDLLKTEYRSKIRAHDLRNFTGKTIRILGLLVTTKYVRTKKKEIMQFGTFLDIEGEFFDTVNFPDSLKNYPYRGTGVYLILGKVVQEFGHPGIEVEKMAKLPILGDPRSE